jgi:hypothetical protein
MPIKPKIEHTIIEVNSPSKKKSQNRISDLSKFLSKNWKPPLKLM